MFVFIYNISLQNNSAKRIIIYLLKRLS